MIFTNAGHFYLFHDSHVLCVKYQQLFDALVGTPSLSLLKVYKKLLGFRSNFSGRSLILMTRTFHVHLFMAYFASLDSNERYCSLFSCRLLTATFSGGRWISGGIPQPGQGPLCCRQWCGSGFNGVPGSVSGSAILSGSRRAKRTNKHRKKVDKLPFLKC